MVGKFGAFQMFLCFMTVLFVAVGGRGGNIFRITRPKSFNHIGTRRHPVRPEPGTPCLRA